MTLEKETPGAVEADIRAHCKALTDPIVTPISDVGKFFTTRQAQLALLGHALTPLSDGTFSCTKWGLTKVLPDMAAVEAFYRQIGGQD